MPLNEIKPHTKAELIKLQQLLTTTKTIESAKIVFPEKLLSFFESEMSKNHKTFETVVKDIKTDLSVMKYIKIYIPFDPSTQLLTRILRAVDVDNSDRYIETIKDESLVGGAKIVIDGKIFDETLDRKIYEKFI